MFLKNFFSKYHFLTALFLVVLSKFSSQHGRCWKLNIWCISDIIISKLREKIRFLHHRNYSVASILIKLSTLQLRFEKIVLSSLQQTYPGKNFEETPFFLKCLGDFYLLRNRDDETFSADKIDSIVVSAEISKPQLYQLIYNSWYESRYI